MRTRKIFNFYTVLVYMNQKDAQVRGFYFTLGENAYYLMSTLPQRYELHFFKFVIFIV